MRLEKWFVILALQNREHKECRKGSDAMDYVNTRIQMSDFVKSMKDATCNNESRCKSCLLESISPNALYLYLILNEVDREGANLGLEESYAQTTGIHFEKKFGKTKDFVPLLKSHLVSGDLLYLVTDLYYEEKTPEYKRNNRHKDQFIILKGYYEESDEFLVIMEDYGVYDKDSAVPSYSEQYISSVKLQKLACKNGLVICNRKRFVPCEGEDCFFVYGQVSITDPGSISFHTVVTLLHEKITLRKQELPDFIQEMKEGIKAYEANLEAYHDRLSFTPDPKEVRSFLSHYRAMEMRKQLFGLWEGKIEEMKWVQDCLDTILTECFKLQRCMIKSLFTNDISYCEYGIHHYLGRLRKLEDCLYERLLSMELWPAKLREREVTKKPDGYSDGIEDIEFTSESLVFLDLTPMFNNQGISDGIESTKADLTGSGMSYYFDSPIPPSKLFRLETFKKKELKDNISCQEQRIEVEEGFYTKLLMAGVAEWGDFKDKLRLEYEDGSMDELWIGLSDWILQPSFQETILFEGKMVENVNGVGVLNQSYRTKLYGVSYPLKGAAKLKRIHLPDQPYIHIFAITLVCRV